MRHHRIETLLVREIRVAEAELGIGCALLTNGLAHGEARLRGDRIGRWSVMVVDEPSETSRSPETPEGEPRIQALTSRTSQVMTEGRPLVRAVPN
jgi:hypothetical protein